MTKNLFNLKMEEFTTGNGTRVASEKVKVFLSGRKALST
jgi:hypothetical protein